MSGLEWTIVASGIVVTLAGFWRYKEPFLYMLIELLFGNNVEDEDREPWV